MITDKILPGEPLAKEQMHEILTQYFWDGFAHIPRARLVNSVPVSCAWF